LPKAADPSALTLEEAVILLAERAAKGPGKGKKKAPAKKTPAKKPAAKKKVAPKK
jgi:DNA topoisomerase-1